MSDLTALRDHAQRLATSDHRDDCDRIHRIVKFDSWLVDHGLDAELSCPDESGHEPHWWTADSGPTPVRRRYFAPLIELHCPGLCGGCMPDRERQLWQQIADEITAYLAPDDDGPELFGEDA